MVTVQSYICFCTVVVEWYLYRVIFFYVQLLLSGICTEFIFVYVQLLLSGNCTEEVRKTVIGLSRDLRGIAFAFNTKVIDWVL